MDKKMRNTLFVSALVLASSIYHSTLNSAQAVQSEKSALAPLLTVSSPSSETFIIAQNAKSGEAIVSAPIGFIAEGLGTEIAVAETEMVLSHQIKSRITRAVFTHGVTQREPIDSIVSISQSYGKMYFFTELSNFNGELVKHRWEHDGKVIAEVEFEINSPRWRAYSSKNISINGLGKWTVFVTNSVGTEIFSNSIVVVN